MTMKILKQKRIVILLLTTIICLNLIIENLIILHYGELKGHIILWWLFERFDDDAELLSIELNDIDTKENEELLIETPEQLWNLIRQIGEK